MRPLLLLACLAALCAADQEVLTLKDGRKLTGVYDPKTETLDMGMAKIQVAEADIDSRRPSAPADSPKDAPAKDAMLLGEPNKLSPEDRAKRLAILRNLLERSRGQMPAARAVLATRQDELAKSGQDPDLKAVENGKDACLSARAEGQVKCLAMYPKADERLIEEWRRRFELQALNGQKAKQGAAERKSVKASEAAKIAQREIDRLMAESAKIQADMDALASAAQPKP